MLSLRNQTYLLTHAQPAILKNGSQLNLTFKDRHRPIRAIQRLTPSIKVKVKLHPLPLAKGVYAIPKWRSGYAC